MVMSGNETHRVFFGQGTRAAGAREVPDALAVVDRVKVLTAIPRRQARPAIRTSEQALRKSAENILHGGRTSRRCSAKMLNAVVSPAGAIDVDCKDLTSRYANDVIASCAFGLKVDSHSDQNNQFFEMGKTASTFKFKQMLMLFAMAACPGIAKVKAP